MKQQTNGYEVLPNCPVDSKNKLLRGDFCHRALEYEDRFYFLLFKLVLAAFWVLMNGVAIGKGKHGCKDRKHSIHIYQYYATALQELL